MDQHRLRKTLMAAAAACFGYSAASLADPVPVGPVIQVNTVTEGRQFSQSVAVDADGDFVIAWMNLNERLADVANVSAQRFNAAGEPQGGEFQVHDVAQGVQALPKVAMAADGSFVVAWGGNGSPAGNEYGIFARRFDAAGVPLGGQFRVNADTQEAIPPDAIALDADGDFVLTWSGSQGGPDSDVRARRFDAAGLALGPEFVVNTLTTGQQRFSSLAMEADGDFLVSFLGVVPGQPYGYGAYARRYSREGVAQGAAFRVDSGAPQLGAPLAVASSALGETVLAWTAVAPGGVARLQVLRLGPAGETLAPETTLMMREDIDQAAVAMDAAGNYVLAYRDRNVATPDRTPADDVMFQRFSADGTPQGVWQRAPAPAGFIEQTPDLRMDADGDIVLSWTSGKSGGFGLGIGYNGQDGEVEGVFAQRLRGEATVDLSLIVEGGPGAAAAAAAQSKSAQGKARPQGAAVALMAAGEGSADYRATLSNLRSPESPTGVPEIDAAIGSAINPRVSFTRSANASLAGAVSSSVPASCVDAGNTTSCRLDQALPAGAVATLRFSLSAPQGQTVSVEGEASTDSLDPTPGNDSGADSAPIPCVAGVISLGTAKVQVSESAGIALVPVQRSGGSCGAASVRIETLFGTALPGFDYKTVKTVLSWADGDGATKQFRIPIRNDFFPELREQLRVRLTKPTTATLGALSLGRVSIVDNDR